MRMRNTSMLRASGLAVAGAAVVLGASAVRADIITVNSDSADYKIHTNDGASFTRKVNANGTRVGYSGDSGYNAVLVFQLPSLPSGQVVTSANLSIRFVNVGGQNYNADLYGLTIKGDSGTLSNEYFQGALDTSNTLIEDNLLTPSSDDSGSGRNASTDAAGDSALATYLDSSYNSGDYVFLRINQDLDEPLPSNENTGYGVLETEKGADDAPLLTLTTVVPEPATGGLALLGLGGLAMLGRRRRRGRA